MFLQEKLNNPYFIIGILVILFSLGFGSAYYTQDQKISKIMFDNNSTINSYEDQINQLNDTIINFIDELVVYNKQLIDIENNLSQKRIDYDALLEDYIKLNTSYHVLFNQYSELELNYFMESEMFLTKTSVSEDYTRVFFNNITFEYPQNLVISLSGLYESIPTNRSGLFTGISFDEEEILTLSWNYIQEEPNLNATLHDAYESIKHDVTKIGSNDTYITDDIFVRYVNYTVTVESETKFMLVSTWYRDDTSHHYLCIIQNNENNVLELFMNMINSYSQY